MLSAGGRPHLSQAFRNVSLHSCIRACALEKEGDGETAPRGEKRRWRGAVMGEGVRVKPRKGSRQTVAAKRNPASPRASEGPGGRTSVGPRAGLCQAVLGGRGGHRGVAGSGQPGCGPRAASVGGARGCEGSSGASRFACGCCRGGRAECRWRAVEAPAQTCLFRLCPPASAPSGQAEAT